MLRTTKRWIAYPLVWLLAMLVPMIATLFTQSSGPAAKVNQFRIESFDASYTAVPAGQQLQLRVQERITAYFPNYRTNRGIERRLDARYGSTSIELQDFKVTDPDGRAMPFQVRRADDQDVILRIGDPSTYVDGEVTYLISYVIGNAMVDAGDRQELYLDVNGTGWLQPFGRVSATVDVSRLADRLLGEQACYQGTAGSTDRCTIEQRGTTFHAAVTDLAPRETMTIAIGFQPGTVGSAVPRPAPAGYGWLGMLAMPVLGLLCLAFALGMRALRRNLRARDDVPTQFKPPAGIPPIAAADFLGRPETGAAAQLAALVVNDLGTVVAEGEPEATAAQDRGRLRRGTAESLRSGLSVRIHNPKEIGGGTLRTICTDLFGDGNLVSLDRVRRSDMTDASARRRDLLDMLGLRGDVLAPGVMLPVGMIVLVTWGWIQLLAGIPGLAWPFLGLGLLAVLLLVAAVHYYPTVGRLTRFGRQTRDHLTGLHRFVTMAEAGRISWLQNAVDAPRITSREDNETLVKLYEPLLPYAIIFGVDLTWQQLLGSLYHREDVPVGDGSAPAAIGAASWISQVSERPMPELYDRREDPGTTWWNSRPAWGEGWIASTRESIARSWDEQRASRDDDHGGGSWSSGSSSSSWSSSSSSSSGSSGGGSSGGGMGGGGGGGW